MRPVPLLLALISLSLALYLLLSAPDEEDEPVTVHRIHPCPYADVLGLDENSPNPHIDGGFGMTFSMPPSSIPKHTATGAATGTGVGTGAGAASDASSPPSPSASTDAPESDIDLAHIKKHLGVTGTGPSGNDHVDSSTTTAAHEHEHEHVGARSDFDRSPPVPPHMLHTHDEL